MSLRNMMKNLWSGPSDSPSADACVLLGSAEELDAALASRDKLMVLFFEHGRVVRRLDGVYHRGLSQGQLEDFARRCAVK